MLRHFYEISTTTYESRSTFYDITRFLYAFWNKKEYALSICGHHLISNNNEYNKYDSTAMTVHFLTFHCNFFWDAYF